VPPALVAGRLVPMRSAGARYLGLAATAGDDAWLLVDGVDPRSSSWALGFELMLLAFAAWSLTSLYRVLRKV